MGRWVLLASMQGGKLATEPEEGGKAAARPTPLRRDLKPMVQPTASTEWLHPSREDSSAAK